MLSVKSYYFNALKSFKSYYFNPSVFRKKDFGLKLQFSLHFRLN